MKGFLKLDLNFRRSYTNQTIKQNLSTLVGDLCMKFAIIAFNEIKPTVECFVLFIFTFTFETFRKF